MLEIPHPHLFDRQVESVVLFGLTIVTEHGIKTRRFSAWMAANTVIPEEADKVSYE
jgi:hypothetical protein